VSGDPARGRIAWLYIASRCADLSYAPSFLARVSRPVLMYTVNPVGFAYPTHGG